MCGIVGIINIDQKVKKVEKQVLQLMMSKILHRGPDSQGTVVTWGGHIGLGAVRLAFLDLDHGNQPIESRCKRGIIVYNGEVYDYAEMVHSLKNNGYRFNTKTDTELVLNLYLKEGYNSFKKLNGEFAFAIYDKNDHSVVLVRDKFGIKPLYYIHSNGQLIFASEIKAIFAAPNTTCAFDYRTIYEQFFRADSLERTLFKNIKVLKPGHFLVVKENTVRVHKYWDIHLPKECEENSNLKTLGHYKQKLHSALCNSVKSRMQSDVAIGSFLSGGLDSSLIAAIMQKYANKPIKTFSIEFKDKLYDESKFSRLVADHIQSDHYAISLSDIDLAHNFPKALYHCEHLCQQIDGTGKYLLAKYASKYVKGVLVGEGADELFLGYPWMKMVKYLENKEYHNKVIAMETARIGLDLNDYKHVNIEEIKKIYGYYPIAIGNVVNMQAVFGNTLFSEDMQHVIHDFDVKNIFFEDLDQIAMSYRSNIRQNQYEFIKKTLCTYIFKFLGDKVEMANSLESRLPFFDNKILDIVAELPEKFLLNGLQEKYILKQIAQDYLPKDIVSRVKHGYSSPILKGFLKKKSPSYFNDLLSPSSLKETNIFDPIMVSKVIKACKARKNKFDQKTTLYERAVIFILSVQLMQQMFIKKEVHLY